MRQRCAKCGSDKIIHDATILDYTRGGSLHLSVAVHEDPGALFFKGLHTGTLRATICAACGHTELKTDNLPALWEAYQKSRGR